MKFLVLILFHFSAWAYIPHSSTILEKTSDFNGDTSYIIKQEVIFQNSKEKLRITENWKVIDGNKLLLYAIGNSTSYYALFIGDSRYTVNASGKLVKSQVSPDFFENFFHHRHGPSIAADLIRQNIAPSAVAEKQRVFYQSSNIDYKGQEFVYLTRVNGVITYGIGYPTPVGSETQNPGIWIEQDQFLIRKIRFPSQTEVSADEYADYTRNLKFPRLRKIKWSQGLTPIRLLNVNAKNFDANELQDFNPNQFAKKAKQARFGQSSLASSIEEFYTRFR